MRIHQVHHLYQDRLARATKPFSARGAKVKRCELCMVAKEHCICDHQPDIETDIAAMVIMSDNEILKPSNTGRLIADVVKECHAFEWSRTEPSAELLALINSPDYQPVIIFPEQYVDDRARLVHSFKQDTERFSSQPKLLLIFLDGSWKEARKMFRKSDYLQKLPVFSVEPEALSEYVLRRSENSSHLATAEVASIVLEQANQPKAAKLLASWFGVFSESYMLSKTRYKPNFEKPQLQQYIREME
ncbi:tRNA-uridine aminocarboxypropyltransferase [Vibrio sp. SCSIO 43136]|uniref:tRNA-uridine aminocarboxypropyltransferase n=1 Tax=Vibrio sp. SCSIO 43136 TaxID=2819101 RepID=UPI002076265E|nr:tRNA-uridine aminocarboxypropyltransferase [Vibrio sp. SCSIO 43136]USD66585.1 DTW domain-containing protein [Vibrio sp. SCSIO 43136]